MKENLIKFSINKFYYSDNYENTEFGFISPILKRRLSALDKMVLSALMGTYTDDIENLVFSSRYGEVDRLIKIISQYKETQDASPNAFSGSVHNYPVGFFLMNIKKSIPYTAISACQNSICAGLLSAVISDYENVLFCHADVYGSQNYALALNLSKFNKNNSQEFLIRIENNIAPNDLSKKYVKLFSGETDILKTPNYTIERIKK